MALRVKAPGADFDVAEARRALTLLCDPTGAHEIRGLPSGAHLLLPGSSPAALAEAAAHLAQSNCSVYVTLNPVPSDCKPEKAVGDRHISRRRWLLIDIDPIKSTTQKDDPATAEERTAVLALARDIRHELTEVGWPVPVLQDSGNGAYLLYRVDLPADDASRDLVREFLKRASARFTGPRGKVDTSTFNAARIAKIAGASNRKHGATASAERPFRLSRLLDVPEELLCITAEQIGAAFQEQTETVVEDASFDFGANAKRSLTVKATAAAGSGYGQAALEREANRLEQAAPGERNNTYNTAVFSLAQLVAGGELTEGEVQSRIVPIAHAIGLTDKEIEDTWSSAFGAGSQKPRQAPPRKSVRVGGSDTQPSEKWRISLDGEILLDGDPAEIPAENDDGTDKATTRLACLTTLGAMLATEYPEPRWVVPGILSEGLNILAGAPKKGKSILALNLALTIAGGGEALGKRVLPCDVLYLSLEDRDRRLKHRALKMLGLIRDGLSDSVAKRLTIATAWPRHDQGGISAINLWRRRVESPGLVIIDTWARFSPAVKPTGSAYTQDSDAMAALQRYANRHGLTMLVVHHTRKASIHKEPEDHVQEVSGTLGLTGVADGILVLIRTKEDHQATLHITGRDVSDQEYILEFIPEHLLWKNLGTKREHVGGRVQQKVLAHLRSLKTPQFASDIARAVGENENSVRQSLNRLQKEHLIRKAGNAWAYPGEADEEMFEP